ncbi:hypothetical protein DFJ43DRAFT_1003007 [Lentinula guzmanii]|uniref:BTB domain-containing protein n=1 Tax=Lentinula guzmanii TaxID=2804957 RepID=A0AA38MX30_9AGAR|nr:hypothetical protein DFJ43DRAFT_1003007 [Lentinula guzmanii]
MNSSAIQSHLYNSLLTGQTSDICIRITGAFDATYHLHRVVLIQAGFWRDLFTGGFVESSAKRQTTGFKSGTRIDSHNSLSSFGAEILDVVLDDRNISRAAFELSISRLYGGGPPLYIHSSLLSTSTHPLTFGFPYQPVLPLSSSLLYPPGHQPATPEFLISLLATSIYLSIPSLASEALTGILKTIGPRTVVYYLRFALGRSRLEESADRSAVGLEGLADIDETAFPQFTNLPAENRNSSVGDDTLFLSASHTATNKDSHLSEYTGSPSSQLPFYYGPISDKIGEACACWLARWGADMFVDEEKVVLEWLNDPSASLESWTSKEERALENPPLSSNTDSNGSSLPTTSTWSPKWSQSTVRSIPRVFTATAAEQEGLSLSWIQALISSDDFFVPAPSLYDSEERYALAKRVVELRRAVRSKCREEDAQWDAFFRTSIYYTNMSSEAVIKISKDISHSTGRAYVDLRTLQEAAWEAGLTKSMITGGNSNDTFLLNATGKVGLTKTVSDALSTLSSDNSFDNAISYFIIPANESLRIGDTITSSGVGNAALDNDQTGERSKPEKIAPIAKTSNEQTFFGLRGNICHVTRTEDADLPPSQLLSAHPPLRFSVEFFNLEMLKEKDRLHSRTVWFAGSLWNVYVQIVQRYRSPGSGLLPNYQLGVYLHRQSPTEKIPPPNSPATLTNLQVPRSQQSLPSSSPPSPSPRSYAFSPLTAYASAPQGASSSVTTSHSPSPSSRLRGNSASSPATPSSHPSTAPGSPSPSGRPLVSVYFSINCASPTGGTQIRFRSAPDVFKVGQSWGWKSSGLLGEIQGSASTNVSNTDGDFEAALVELDRNSPPVGTEVSFRATVVLGIV